MTILSQMPDGLGFYYGFLPGDYRQINVRHERGLWVSYAGGSKVGETLSKREAEAMAVAWLKNHPEGVTDEAQ